MADPLILALGGTRSGKSRFGLAAARRLAGDGRVWFLATAWPGDPEMDDRIERHRRERPADWPTIDVGTDLAGALGRTEPTEPVLIDGLTLWLSAILGDDPVGPDPLLDGPVADALEAIARAARARSSWSATRSAGGIVPMHAGARVYRDLVGMVHQRIAAQADEVYLLVAGLPLRLKGPAVMTRTRAHSRPTERALAAALDAIGPLDATAMAAAAAHLDRLTKPPGSLGRLESLLIELAGITGRADPSVARRADRRRGRRPWRRPPAASRPTRPRSRPRWSRTSWPAGPPSTSSRRGRAPGSSSSTPGSLRPCPTVAVDRRPGRAHSSGPGSATARAT